MAKLHTSNVQTHLKAVICVQKIAADVLAKRGCSKFSGNDLKRSWVTTPIN